jgi:hypothetical protein
MFYFFGQCEENLILMRGKNQILSMDVKNREVTVEAGISLQGGFFAVAVCFVIIFL